jgi:hypothetical protein
MTKEEQQIFNFALKSLGVIAVFIILMLIL